MRALSTPWQSKRFDSDAATGGNRLTRSTGLASNLRWPLYAMRDNESGKLAFNFKTYVEAGKDPNRLVMMIGYADVEENPSLIARSIREELVEVVRRVYLEKILFNSKSGNYSKMVRIPPCLAKLGNYHRKGGLSESSVVCPKEQRPKPSKITSIPLR